MEIIDSRSGVAVMVESGDVYHWLLATGRLKVSRSNWKKKEKKNIEINKSQ